MDGAKVCQNMHYNNTKMLLFLILLNLPVRLKKKSTVQQIFTKHTSRWRYYSLIYMTLIHKKKKKKLKNVFCWIGELETGYLVCWELNAVHLLEPLVIFAINDRDLDASPVVYLFPDFILQDRWLVIIRVIMYTELKN